MHWLNEENLKIEDVPLKKLRPDDLCPTEKHEKFFLAHCGYFAIIMHYTDIKLDAGTTGVVCCVELPDIISYHEVKPIHSGLCFSDTSVIPFLVSFC